MFSTNRLQRILHERVHVRQQLLLAPGHLLVCHTLPLQPSLGLSPQPPPEHRWVQRHFTSDTRPRPSRCSPWRPRPRWGWRCRLRTSHWTRSQEPRILCNKIIVHIDTILHKIIIIEYDDPYLKQKDWHCALYNAASRCWSCLSASVCLHNNGGVAGPRPHFH